MSFILRDEKIFLIILVTTALIMLSVSIYLGINTQRNNEDIICDKIHVICTSSDIEHDFKEKYEKLNHQMGKYDIEVYNNPINSASIVPGDWNNIVTSIKHKYGMYNGFVIMCGKDTMPYTASALAFMLENLGKPVVLTDQELAQALVLISKTKIPEVMVASGDTLLRGCRTVVNSAEYYESPLYPKLTVENALAMPKEPIKFMYVNPKVKIILIKIFPSMDAKYLLNIVANTEIHGIVFEVYGSGHAPITKGILQILQNLAKKGVIMVAVSQCNSMIHHDIDPRLLEAGVLSGADMTPAAAFAKLHFLLGNVEEKQLIGKLMEQSFRGEMSV